MSEMGLMIC